MNHHVTALYNRRANRIEYCTMGHVIGGCAAVSSTLACSLMLIRTSYMIQVVNVNLWAGSAVRWALYTPKSLLRTWTKCNTFKLKLQSLIMLWRLELSSLGHFIVHDLQNLTKLLPSSKWHFSPVWELLLWCGRHSQEHSILFSTNSLPWFIYLFI